MKPNQPADPELIRTHVGSGVAAWSEEGVGPSVVMVHGMPGSGRDFRWLAPGLLPDHHVVRVDLPGFGGTPAAGHGLGIRGMTSYLSRVLQSLDLRDVTVVGHSFGAAVALATAARATDRISRVGLICPIGLRPHIGFRKMPSPKRVSGALRAPGLGRVTQKVLEIGARQAGFPRRTPPAELANTMHHLADFDFAQQARAVDNLKQPTFVTWCEDDPLIEPEIVEALAARLPDGPRLRFPDGKHNPQKVHGVEIADALRAWISA